jgi:hypothetical protein
MRKILHKSAVSGFLFWLYIAIFPIHSAAADQANRSVTVTVDSRVELMSVIFRLAGHPEYSQGRVASYTKDVDDQFGPFRNHAAVNLARRLRSFRGIAYNAPMGLAVHVTDAPALEERIPLSPLPQALDPRWTPESAREFLVEARKFAADAHFKEFYDRHESLYQTNIGRMQQTLDQNAHLDWFDRFFGPRKGTAFRVILGMLNGGGSYGARFEDLKGKEEIYSILGVWIVDSQGQPVFPPGLSTTIVHELTHSYTNPLVDRFFADLRGSGETLIGLVGKELRKQAYPSWQTLMYESLVRACTLRYIHDTEGQAAMEKAAVQERSWSFYWAGELADVLAEYDTQPRKYNDLGQFFPRIISFFNSYAKEAPGKIATIKEEKEKQEREWREKGPKVVAMDPENGAQNVDPNLKAIVIAFDRPMKDKSWAVVRLVESQDQYPEGAGPVGYDSNRKVFTMPVALKPGKEYAFGLNAEQYLGFCGDDGAPLAPVKVHFRTRTTDK